MDHGVTIVPGRTSPSSTASTSILTPGAVQFVAWLHREFDPARRQLLHLRRERQERLDAGEYPDFRPDTRPIREGNWQVAPAAPDLQDRRVEITGPVDRKMMINALNSGASVFMADFEDATSPTWANLIEGQANCRDAVRRTIHYTSPAGKQYALAERTATLVVRPRGWHLEEAHVQVDGHRVSASLFDFGLYFFHNARHLVDSGSGPYFYLPKLESHAEARLWNDVFVASQQALGIPRGTIRATVLIETILAAFEMDEILYELRDHAAGLNAGRWDYIFSIIKKLGRRGGARLPDRAQVTMTVPFMRAYTRLLVQTCHQRGAHAIGGMAAFVPSRHDAAANALAFAKVREDKAREANDGFDGSWVAHPDLVPVAREVFDKVLGERPDQKHRCVEPVSVSQRELLDFVIPGGQVTAAGVENGIEVALQYLEAWLRGIGAVTIHNLMEDAATAEIARAQLWQWVHLEAPLPEGHCVTAAYFRTLLDHKLRTLGATGEQAETCFRAAAVLLEGLVLDDEFAEFMTIPAYHELVGLSEACRPTVAG